MAIYRPIQVSFWQDPYILELTKEQRYFYLYLMTNSKTTQCGIYQLSFKIVAFETGIEEEACKGLIRGLQADEKVVFDPRHDEIMLLNWYKYNPLNNQNIEKRIVKELGETKSKDLIDIYTQIIFQLDYDAKIIKGAYEGLMRGYEEINININTNINNNINTSIVGDTPSNVEKSKLPVPSNSKYTFDENHMHLAKFLLSEIRKNNPNFKEPNLKSWANAIRLMVERDNRTLEDIASVIIWCQNDSFWKGNILSANKLRDQYDQLYVKMKNEPQTSRNMTGLDDVEVGI